MPHHPNYRAGRLFYWRETNWVGMIIDNQGGLTVWDPDKIMIPGEQFSWETMNPDSIEFDVHVDPEEWL